MHKKTILWAILALTALISGCATFTPSRDYKITDETKNGLVILSFTQPFPVMKWMYYDVKNGKPIQGFESFLSTVRRINELIEYDNTLVYPIELPGGEYEIFRWTTPEHGTYYASTKHFSVRFRSIPGKVIYAGNLQVSMDGKQFGLQVRDDRDKVIPLFLKYYPNIKQDQVEIQLMDFRGSEK